MLYYTLRCRKLRSASSGCFSYHRHLVELDDVYRRVPIVRAYPLMKEYFYAEVHLKYGVIG